MISMTTMQKISTALKQCDLELSSGDCLVLDKYAEIIGRIDFEKGFVAVFSSYTHSRKVVQRLKKLSVPASVEDPTAGAFRVLYDTPTLTQTKHI